MLVNTSASKKLPAEERKHLERASVISSKKFLESLGCDVALSPGVLVSGNSNVKRRLAKVCKEYVGTAHERFFLDVNYVNCGCFIGCDTEKIHVFLQAINSDIHDHKCHFAASSAGCCLETVHDVGVL
jgi:hypothetical protein